MNKEEILRGVLALNGDEHKYKISVVDSKIITEVKWMDAVLFTTDAVTDEMRLFKFTVVLHDDNTYSELDESKNTSKSVGATGFGMKYGSFKGRSVSFGKTIAIGHDKESGETGVIDITFNSEEYKRPVREYLASCGYKKAKKGFFKSLFGKNS